MRPSARLGHPKRMTSILFRLLLVVLPANHANAVEAKAVSGLWAWPTFLVGIAGELRVTPRAALWQDSISGATAEAKAGRL